MASKGRSAREVREEIERARARQSSRFKFVGRFVTYLLSAATYLAVVFAVAIAVVIIIHLFSTGDFAESLRMVADDFEVVAACPEKPDVWAEFIARSETEHGAYKASVALGGDLGGLVCAD